MVRIWEGLLALNWRSGNGPAAVIGRREGGLMRANGREEFAGIVLAAGADEDVLRWRMCGDA